MQRDFMNSPLPENRPDHASGYASNVLAVDDPVYVYIVDMIRQLGAMAFDAGQTGLGQRLHDVVAARP